MNKPQIELIQEKLHMSAPMFEQVKKSGICKTGSVLKGGLRIA
jgi:hypothetical protein